MIKNTANPQKTSYKRFMKEKRKAKEKAKKTKKNFGDK